MSTIASVVLYCIEGVCLVNAVNAEGGWLVLSQAAELVNRTIAGFDNSISSRSESLAGRRPVVKG